MEALSRGFRSPSSTAIVTLVACLVLLLLPQPMVAQTIAGSITGTLVDPTGAVVPNATVTALNQDQHTTAQMKTDAAGRFVFPILLPGNYTITAEAAGFKKIEKKFDTKWTVA